MKGAYRAVVGPGIFCLLLPAAAAAQTTQAKQRGAGDPSVNSSRRLLSTWLEDAYTPDWRGGFAEIDFRRWNGVGANETDVPWFQFGYAVTDRLQLGASTSVARAAYRTSGTVLGLGETYIQTKFQCLNPEYKTIGLALSPAVEILSNAVVHDPALRVSRVNLVLPVTLHAAFENGAVYGTVAYFSRGILSAAIQAERTISDRLTLAGVVTRAYATRMYFTSASSGIQRSRTDAAVEVYVSLTDKLTIVGSIGRTISKTDVNSALLDASLGLKFEWRHIGK